MGCHVGDQETTVLCPVHVHIKVDIAIEVQLRHESIVGSKRNIKIKSSIVNTTLPQSKNHQKRVHPC